MNICSNPEICMLSADGNHPDDSRFNPSAILKTKAGDSELDRQMIPKDKAGDSESGRHGMPETPASDPNAARNRVPPVTDDASGPAGHPMSGGKAGGAEPNRYWMPETLDDDPAALAALVADYLPLVRRAARCMPEREQEDAIAEGQYQLIRAIKAYDPNTGLDLPGYLKIKIKYGMFNYFRRYRCEADRTVAEADILTRAEALQAVQPDPMDSPAAQVLHHLDEERLRTALDALSPGERACLEALYWMGMGYDETAQAMGVTANTVTKMRSRALKKLKIRMV